MSTHTPGPRELFDRDPVPTFASCMARDVGVALRRADLALRCDISFTLTSAADIVYRISE